MSRHASLVMAAALACLTPAAAIAQTASPLRVEPVESGFVIAPDARFTTVNGEFATLAGVYGGWSTDRTLLIGAGGYWLANRHDDLEMQYGGGLVRWTIGGHRTLGVSAGALIGLGDATLAKTHGDLFGEIPSASFANRDRRFQLRGRGSAPITSTTPIRVNDDFFIAEPQVNALWTITRWMRLDAGVGYRLIGGADLLRDDLRGVNGSIALQLGGR